MTGCMDVQASRRMWQWCLCGRLQTMLLLTLLLLVKTRLRRQSSSIDVVFVSRFSAATAPCRSTCDHTQVRLLTLHIAQMFSSDVVVVDGGGQESRRGQLPHPWILGCLKIARNFFYSTVSVQKLEKKCSWKPQFLENIGAKLILWASVISLLWEIWSCQNSVGNLKCATLRRKFTNSCSAHHYFNPRCRCSSV